MLVLEFRELRFELADVLVQAVAFGLEEGGRIARQLRAVVEIFVQIQRRELVGHLGGQVRDSARVGDFECDRGARSDGRCADR